MGKRADKQETRSIQHVLANLFLDAMALAAQIAESLAATLNLDPNVRIAAELRLAEYFTNPGRSHRCLIHLIS